LDKHLRVKELAFGAISLYNVGMQYRFTEYFEKEVLRKRPYIKKEWCIRVLEEPLRTERQGKVLRVVTLEDRVTIHNAFPDRRYKL